MLDFLYILGHLQESDINTPAIGAAFVIKRHNKSDVETEISLEIGELVSVVCLSTQILLQSIFYNSFSFRSL